MKRQNDIDARIHRMCMISLTNEAEMLRLGTDLLATFRDVCRRNTQNAVDTVNSLCSYNDEFCDPADEYRQMHEAVTRIEFFASQMERSRYETDIDGILHTDWMIRVMDILKMKVYTFANYGPEFVEILNLCYMNAFDYSESDILEVLNMGRSTFYKKKKRAVILFGLAFLSFKANCLKQTGAAYAPLAGDQIRMTL